MKLWRFFVMLVLVAAAGCNHRSTTKAYVFERKHLPENRLQLKYRFVYNDRQMVDSATINNRVISGDTITVEINPQKGVESQPVFDHEGQF